MFYEPFSCYLLESQPDFIKNAERDHKCGFLLSRSGSAGLNVQMRVWPACGRSLGVYANAHILKEKQAIFLCQIFEYPYPVLVNIF